MKTNTLHHPKKIEKTIHFRYQFLSILDKVLKEIVVQNVGNAFQQACVNCCIGVNLIQMVGRAGNLACEPNRGSALLLQHGFDSVPDMYVLDLRHGKSVEFVSCLNLRVTTPHLSNKLFHAVINTAFRN